jgi:hypothetical protein
MSLMACWLGRVSVGGRRKEEGGRREKGGGRREKGGGRREKGEGRRGKGEERRGEGCRVKGEEKRRVLSVMVCWLGRSKWGKEKGEEEKRGEDKRRALSAIACLVGRVSTRGNKEKCRRMRPRRVEPKGTEENLISLRSPREKEDIRIKGLKGRGSGIRAHGHYGSPSTPVEYHPPRQSQEDLGVNRRNPN